jgi:hypothetical protein
VFSSELELRAKNTHIARIAEVGIHENTEKQEHCDIE